MFQEQMYTSSEVAEILCNELADFIKEYTNCDWISDIMLARLGVHYRRRCADIRRAYAMPDEELAALGRLRVPPTGYELVSWPNLFPKGEL